MVKHVQISVVTCRLSANPTTYARITSLCITPYWILISEHVLQVWRYEHSVGAIHDLSITASLHHRVDLVEYQKTTFLVEIVTKWRIISWRGVIFKPKPSHGVLLSGKALMGVIIVQCLIITWLYLFLRCRAVEWEPIRDTEKEREVEEKNKRETCLVSRHVSLYFTLS